MKTAQVILNEHLSGVEIGDSNDHILKAMETYAVQYHEQKLLQHGIMQAEGSDGAQGAAVGKERGPQSQSEGNSESTAPDIGDFVPMIWLIEKLRWPPEKRATMNELIAKVQDEFTFTIKRKSSEGAL